MPTWLPLVSVLSIVVYLFGMGVCVEVLMDRGHIYDATAEEWIKGSIWPFLLIALIPFLIIYFGARFAEGFKA